MSERLKLDSEAEIHRLRHLLIQKELLADKLQDELDRVSYTYDESELIVRVGDKVQSLYDQPPLVAGEHYTVKRISCGQIMVEGGNTFWQSHRFLLMESAHPAFTDTEDLDDE